MKKLFFIIAFFASILSIKAQNYGRNGREPMEREQQQGGPQKIPTAAEMAATETKRLTELLDLTTEQADKVKAISLNYGQQRLDLLQALRQTKDQDAIENQLKGIKLAENSALNEILTPEQQVIYTKGKKPKVKGKDKKQKVKDKVTKETETKN